MPSCKLHQRNYTLVLLKYMEIDRKIAFNLKNRCVVLSDISSMNAPVTAASRRNTSITADGYCDSPLFYH